MWGWVTKVGAWAWAHKQEAALAWKLYGYLRAERRKNQRPGETAIDYYKRVGVEVLRKALNDLVKRTEQEGITQ